MPMSQTSQGVFNPLRPGVTATQLRVSTLFVSLTSLPLLPTVLTRSRESLKSSFTILAVVKVLGKLKKEVEKAKHALSSQQSVRIEIESFEDSNVLMTKPESITIKNAKGRLSQEEIKRMLKPSST
ncbi:hypothetical protein JOM56_015646 [Amanita muscaria]